MKDRLNWIALALSLLGIAAAWLVAHNIFDGVPHLEDEMAYVWQARVFASGRITLPSVPFDQEFLVPFVVDYHGQRFGKYPPGWPLALAAGILLGARDLVNPLLAGLALWLVYRLGKRLFTPAIGLLAAGLLLISPFFLLNSGSLLSHPLGLALALAFCLFWLEAFATEKAAHPDRAAWVAAACLGFLALTRPFSALAIALPFAVHAVFILWKGSRAMRWRLVIFTVLALLISSLLFIWQYRLTGNPLLNPYILWWPYDIVGFGPGHGTHPGGHTLDVAVKNMLFSLEVGWLDLFGWGSFSWLLLPFGAWAARRNPRAWLAGLMYPCLVLAYLAYWIGSWLFGPRYYYEGVSGLALFSSAGFAWLAGWPLQTRAVSPALPPAQRKARSLAAAALLTGLVGFNMLVYLPMRLDSMKNLYEISAAALAPFQTLQTQAIAPALVLVNSPRWMGYGALLELESPDLSSPLIFAWSSGPIVDAKMADYFKGARRIFTYTAGQPASLREITPP